MRPKILLSILFIIVLVIVGALYFYFQEKKAVSNIQTFAECKENGFPVQESNPAHCMTPDGRTFIEEIQVVQDPHTNLIQIESPKLGDSITSPVTIKGQARGYWFFEASFPVEIIDSRGQQIATGPAQASGEWMTQDFVPFSVTLQFHSTTTQPGTIVLHKDNPSGLPENEDSISIPVTIQATE